MEYQGKYSRIISLKGIITGFLLGLCVTIVMGTNGGSSGRYECCAAGNNSETVFVIDTQTGQTWRLDRTSTIDYGTPLERKSERTKQRTSRAR